MASDRLPGTSTSAAQWQVTGTGDFNGDGTADVLLRNSTNGQFNIWQMSNGQIAQNLDIGVADPTQWQVAGTGDFYGNGTDDIVLRNTTNGQVNIWQMSSGQIAQVGGADPTQWQVQQSGGDLVTAPSGSATLDALAAHTVFDFSAGTFGNDTVVWFDDQQDQFLISHTLAANFAAIQADETAVGASTLITSRAGQSILVSGVSPASLMAGNFHFV
jgi:hypothetical protein